MNELNIEILGRIIFFLCPSSVIQEELIPELSSMEYETYTLTDTDQAKTVLRRYPGSICFINIDTGFSDEWWQEYVQSFSQDDSLSSILVGIVSNTINEELRALYVLEIGVPCGFVSLRKGISYCLKQIVIVLEQRSAKGRRRYVRARCEKKTMASVNFLVADARISMSIRDISSVGFACTAPGAPVEGIVEKMMIKNMQLTLKGVLIPCSAVVFAIKPDDAVTVYVMLFSKDFSSTSRGKVRAYIRSYLQSVIDNIKAD